MGEGGLDHAWPEYLFIAAIKQAGPEAEIELGNDPPGFEWFVLPVQYALGLVDRRPCIQSISGLGLSYSPRAIPLLTQVSDESGVFLFQGPFLPASGSSCRLRHDLLFAQQIWENRLSVIPPPQISAN